VVGGPGCYLGRHSLRGDHDRLRAIQRECETREDREVGVKLDTREAAHTQRREAVLMLKRSEFAFDRRAATVEVAEPIRVSRDVREPSPSVVIGRTICLPFMP
jgi:hypothetical protein